MTESNKRVTQFGVVFILCAVIIYFFMSAQRPPSNINTHTDHKTSDSLNTVLQKELKELEVLLEKDPHNVELVTRIGNLYYDMSEYDKAIDYYEQSLSLKPDDPFVLTDCAVMYYNVGKAERQLNISIKLSLSSPTWLKPIITRD